MDTYDVETVKDALPRVLEMVADGPTFEAWLEEQGINKEFLYACGMTMQEMGIPSKISFLVATCVAWEVAKK